jgi:uncharacterized protein
VTNISTTSTALVTGAGAGTGREFVRLLLADDAKVLAVSLLDDELSSLQDELDPTGQRLTVKQADLSVPGAAEMLLAWCDDQGHHVDTLINNAGFALYGDPTEIDLGKLERMLLLNVVTSTKLSMVFGQRMKDIGRGRILVMGSIAGFSPTVRFAAYAASKAYTNAFALALGADLEKSGVTVTCVAPGSFQSKFAETAQIAAFQGNSITKRIYLHEKLTARTVALAGYHAMNAGKPMVTVGIKGVIAKGLARIFSPAFMARRSRIL